MNAITADVVSRVLEVVDAGLCRGKGKPIPGKMCVEAAVCFALGLPHDDNPPCVHEVVRAFKIRLNDSNWSSDIARAKGMRRIAVAQLGSTEIDGRKFAEMVAIGTVARVLPAMLAEVAKRFPAMSDAFASASDACATVTTPGAAESAAGNAKAVCKKTRAHAIAYAAAAARAAAAHAVVYAAYADALDAAAAHAAYAAYAAALDAAVADRAATHAAVQKRDEILSLSAEIACDALIACGSEGVKFLYLTEEN